MDKKKIEELMKKRNPIYREPVKPVDLYKTANQQASKTVNQQTSKQAEGKLQTKTEKTSNKKELIKYTTYLPEDLIVKIKMQAVLQKKKSYEIVTQALEKFFKE